MRYFYIAIAETKWLEDIFAKISEWSDRLGRVRGLRVGVLIRFTKWRACLPCKLAERYDVPLFVDNGAFDYLRGLDEPSIDAGALRKWLSSYASWLSSWYPYVTAAAMPDVPVHGREFLPPDIRLQRILLTRDLHLGFARMLASREPAALSKAIIVIQGFDVHEYQLSASLNVTPELAETCTLGGGCPYRGVVGVGSVCVRKPSAKGKTGVLAGGRAAGTLAGFMREFLNARWPREITAFHFFGLHTDAVQRFATHKRYFASDTGAHGLNYKYKWKTRLGCRELNKECYLRAIESQIRTTLGRLLNPPLAA